MMAMPEYMEEPEWLRIGRLVAESLIAFFGVLGNVAVILAIATSPLMYTVTNIFIRNLAVADLGVLLLAFPFAVIREQTLLHWPLGQTVCEIIYPISEIFIGVSGWSMVVIAIDRYRGIVNDSHLKSLKKARYICLVPWVTSFLVLTLPLLIVSYYWEQSPYSDCINSWPDPHRDAMRQAYIVSTALYTYIIPLIIIFWTYYKIFRKLGKSTAFNESIRRAKDIRGENTPRHDEARIKRNIRAKRILTPVVVVFALTLLPVTVLRLALVYVPSLVFHRYVWLMYNICVIATVANSSCNPFIYAIVCHNFRKAFSGVLRIRENIRRGSVQIYAQLSSASGTWMVRSRRSIPVSRGSTSSGEHGPDV